jgi:hypothetical protein
MSKIAIAATGVVRSAFPLSPRAPRRRMVQQTSDCQEMDLMLSSHEFLHHWIFELGVKDLCNTANEVPANVGNLLDDIPSLGRTITGRASFRY